MQLAVELLNISKQFPGTLANDDVTVKIKKGSVVCLVGENGAGKSTLMNILYGMLKPTSGIIKINGEEVSFNSSLDALKKNIGMVHQHFMLVEELSVLENIILGMEPGKSMYIDYKKARAEIMMNSIAQLFSNYLATYPFKGELPMGATYKISENAMLPKLVGSMNDLNFGFIIAVLVAIILYIILFKTKFGYESRAAGISRTFSKYIGIDAAKKTIIIVIISGAIAGLAGAEQVMGVNYRYISDFSPGLGYTGITVALLARNNPLGCIITAIFFGALTNGAIQMEVMTNISRDLVSSVQAIMIIFIAADFAFDYFKKKKLTNKLPKEIKEG